MILDLTSDLLTPGLQSCHMSTDWSQFSDYRPLAVSLGITLGDGHHLKAVGRGSVTLEME